MRKGIAVSLLMLVVVSACGDDSSDSGGEMSDTEKALSNAIVEFIVSDDSFSARPITTTEAECLAEGTIRKAGVDGLAEIGITADSIPEDNPFENAPDMQVDAYVDTFFECLDIAELFAAEMGQDGAFDSDSLSCLAEEFGQGDFLRQLMRTTIVGEDFESNPELMTQLFEVLLACLSAEDFADLAG
jgi:hypothetical protein